MCDVSRVRPTKDSRLETERVKTMMDCLKEAQEQDAHWLLKPEAISFRNKGFLSIEGRASYGRLTHCESFIA